MKILHLYKAYYPVVGGIENHIKLLAESQVALGHEVTVLVTSESMNTVRNVMNGVQVIKVGRLVSLASTPLSLRLFAQLRTMQPDITHLHFPYPVGEIAQYFVGKSAHTLVTYHSDIIRQVKLKRLYAPLMHKMLHKAERLIVSSQAYLQSSPVLAQYRNKCVVIPFGINQERISTPMPEAAAELRRQYGQGPLLLFVGVLRYYKGLQYLIEAMKAINGKLIVVGDGPYGYALRQQAFQAGLSAKVFFVGRISDDELPAYYQAADCFVLPASERSEAFGLVLIEALANGLPIISTELGTGTSFVNLHDESGLVVPPKDASALIAAVNRLFTEPHLRERLALGARARARLFRAERMVAETMAVYQQIANGEA